MKIFTYKLVLNIGESRYVSMLQMPKTPDDVALSMLEKEMGALLYDKYKDKAEFSALELEKFIASK